MINKLSINRRRPGSALVYTTVSLTVLIGFASLAVDLGRAQLAKTELRRAADAAARYAAQGVASNSVSANAIAAAAENTVDGSALVLKNSDIKTGTWSSGAFHSGGGGGGTTAVQITAKRTKQRGTGIPLLFAGILGQSTLDITVQAVATYIPPVSTSINAQATGNPWLAGMPNGTTANTFDTAPGASPTQVGGLTMTSGMTLNFSFAGNASYLPGTSAAGPDGNTGFMLYNHIYTGYNGGREHGMSNLTAPVTAVIGVFLDNTQPDLAGALPADLDFTSDTSRDFTSLSPALRQPFFIGDGLREDGTTPQDFIVPSGATRLYIGVMDGQQWSDNTGSFNTSISKPPVITMVQ